MHIILLESPWRGFCCYNWSIIYHNPKKENMAFEHIQLFPTVVSYYWNPFPMTVKWNAAYLILSLCQNVALTVLKSINRIKILECMRIVNIGNICWRVFYHHLILPLSQNRVKCCTANVSDTCEEMSQAVVNVWTLGDS